MHGDLLDDAEADAEVNSGNDEKKNAAKDNEAPHDAGPKHACPGTNGDLQDRGESYGVCG